MNLRKLAEQDLSTTLESQSDFGLPVILIGPTGIKYPVLNGQVMYEAMSFNAETGQPVIEERPIVTLRLSTILSTCSVIPSGLQKWLVRIPKFPDPASATEDYMLETVEQSRSIGFVRLFLQRIKQA